MILALFGLAACDRTPEFEELEGDFHAELVEGHIYVDKIPLYYTATDLHFPIRQSADGELYLPEGTGWNYEDHFAAENPDMVALGISEDTDITLEPDISFTPERPSFRVAAGFTATLFRNNCEIELPLALNTDPKQTCGATPLSDFSRDEAGYFQASALVSNIGNYIDDAGCLLAGLFPEEYENAHACVSFRVSAPDLYESAMETFPNI